MKYLVIICLLCFTQCKSAMIDINNHPKITFDLSNLDEKGLSGNDLGKVALSYEFCIPREADKKDIILSIDPTIQFTKSRGRIGCSKNEYLCLGTTNQKYKTVFSKLVKLPFVKKIDQTFFE